MEVAFCLLILSKKKLVFQNKIDTFVKEKPKVFPYAILYVCFGLCFLSNVHQRERFFNKNTTFRSFWLKYKILTGIPTSVPSLKTWPAPQQLNPNKPEIKIVGLGAE